MSIMLFFFYRGFPEIAIAPAGIQLRPLQPERYVLCGLHFDVGSEVFIGGGIIAVLVP